MTDTNSYTNTLGESVCKSIARHTAFAQGLDETERVMYVAVGKKK